MEAQRHRPLGVTILAVLAGIAFVVNAFIALIFLGALPFTLFGGLGFFGQALVGAILWGALAVIWGGVASSLWNLNPQAWTFVVVLTVLNLILDLVSVLGASTWQAVLPSVVLNAVILIYSLSPGVKEAFGHPGQHLGS
jgi:hypothetical protein